MDNKNKVELIDWYGGDRAIARAAWVSTQADVNLKSDEQIKDLIVNKLWNNGSGKPHKCYDRETEVLTSDGWKLFSNLKSTDEVCSIDPGTHIFRFEVPSEIVEFDYDEPMYYVRGQQLDLAVTKGHRMFVSTTHNKTYGKKFEVKTVEELEGKTVKYLKSAKNPNTTNLMGGNFAKLLGFFIGDGYITVTNDIKFHLKKSRKIEYLKSLGYKVLEQAHNSFIIRDKELGVFLRENCYCNKNKKLPDNFMEYSKEDVINLLEGLKNSDGSIKRATWVYHTTSSILKEQLKTLACLNEFVFTESSIVQNTVPLYRLVYSTRISPEVINQPSRKSKNSQEEWKMYKGKVYCVTVSTGLIMVRRNGQTCISGNTPFERGLAEFNILVEQASHIQTIKHRLAAVNGESARYMELKSDNFYIPEDWKVIPFNKENISDEWGLTFYDCETWAEVLERTSIMTNELYHEALKQIEPVLGRKRAKESARFFKTMNSQINLSVMMNMSCFYNFVTLRDDSAAQREIAYVARDMVAAVKNIEGNPFKYTMEAFKF